MKGEGFEIDWQSKCDFTASTYAISSTMNNFSSIDYYETNADSELVPFGSDSAFTQSRTDITIVYRTDYGGEAVIYNELKERSEKYPHNSYYVTASTEGEIMEPDKVKHFRPLLKEGKQVRWCVLYPDNKIRIWNLNKLDIDTLPRKPIRKHRYTVIPDSPYVVENEYLLPASESIIIDRING